MIKKVAFSTLGCKLNFSETSTLSQMFTEKKYQRVPFNQKADIYVINTCTVTANADAKSRRLIRKAIKTNTNAYIIVIGCYAQLKPTDILQIKGVDLVLGANEKLNVLKYIDDIENKKAPKIYSCDINDVNNFFPAFSFGDRTRSFLKIQDGCDYNCTYCTIPLARGRSRNQDIAETVKQAKKIAAKGAKEIILTGVNIGDFGQSTNETFFDLIKELSKVDGIERYRISSIEPNLLTNDIINFVAQNNKMMPHFHIPLQAGNDEILKKMKRRYNTGLFKEKIKTINKIFNQKAFIGVDVITGFPGETDKHFEQTYNFLDSLNVSFLHVFTYSDRENTESYKIKNKVDNKTKEYRSKELHKLSQKKHIEFYQRNLKSKHKVLFESQNNNGIMYGFTDNYIKVAVNYDKSLINNIFEVKLLNFDTDNNVNVEILDKNKSYEL